MSGQTINDLIQYYPTQGQIGLDTAGYIRKDGISGNTIYYGFALSLGANPASAVWKIRKETITGNTSVVQYADGDLNYDNIWNNRGSLTYR